MDINFCVHWKATGNKGDNQYCRTCPEAAKACNTLWNKVKALSESHNNKAIDLPNTSAALLPHLKNEDVVRLQVNARWNLPKEDFLHFIGTGYAKNGKADQRANPKVSPSLTRQEPYVQAVVELLGGGEIEEIKEVIKVQKENN